MPKITCVACLAVLLVTAVTAQTTGSYEKVHSSLMAQAEANAHGYGQVGFSPEILAIPQKPFTATRTYSYQRTENGKNVGERVTAECTIARDDKGRILVAICHNMHLGDAWEHADDPRYPERFSSLAYRLGINYVIYGMTH